MQAFRKELQTLCDKYAYSFNHDVQCNATKSVAMQNHIMESRKAEHDSGFNLGVTRLMIVLSCLPVLFYIDYVWTAVLCTCDMFAHAINTLLLVLVLFTVFRLGHQVLSASKTRSRPRPIE